MFDQQQPEKLDVDIPIKGMIIFAVSMGISFGLCSVSLAFGRTQISGIAAPAFFLSCLGRIVCVIWFVVALIVN